MQEIEVFLLAGSGLAAELSLFVFSCIDKFCLYKHKRCICMRVLDIVN